MHLWIVSDYEWAKLRPLINELTKKRLLYLCRTGIMMLQVCVNRICVDSLVSRDTWTPVFMWRELRWYIQIWLCSGKKRITYCFTSATRKGEESTGKVGKGTAIIWCKGDYGYRAWEQRHFGGHGVAQTVYAFFNFGVENCIPRWLKYRQVKMPW